MIEILKKFNNEILGLNRRNQDYVRLLNSGVSKAVADEKIKTKRILAKIGILTPELYKVIRTKKQLEYLDWDSLPNSFVLKPNKGTGGNGIIVFYGKKKGKYEWIRPNGTTMSQSDIILHIENILEGRFSMGNQNDIAIVEERVKIDKTLKAYTYKGVPDVRIIVFNKIPVMAMLRLPTKRSNGTANLHSGAICVGIDIASGVTMSGMYLNPNPIIEDTYKETEFTLDLEKNLPLRGIQIPFWDKILEIAVKCQEVSQLGYLGVDIAIDQDKGPVVFEINARPGLGIQVANKEGLRKRLERVKGLEVKSLKHGINISKNLFGGQVEKQIEKLSGKTVVNLVEKVSVYYKGELEKAKVKNKNTKNIKKEIVNAMLDTGILTSRIDWKLASMLGYYDTLKYFEAYKNKAVFHSFKDAQEYIDTHLSDMGKHPGILRFAKISEDGKVYIRPVILIDLRIESELKKVEMVVGKKTDMLYPILIGRKDLNGYLIDPSQTFTK
ncbi:MAG TPA: sugar-transfer associated ATP-grasp domain-containing protein [Candidatus Dojkabacteria bacterium]|nr:sugar-transfer associated ATP-grasp domain-containing protein [Candidatus Dojkabacteria bacterium]